MPYQESNLGKKLNLKGKKAENFVNELAKRSFFEDWCYLNPKLPNDKELCDLLIIYDDIAIIWQIKDLKLDKDNKYKEGKVKKNLNQILTAKNRLFGLKTKIELENPRRGKEIFDPKKIKKIYSISALLGKGEDYFSFVEIIKNQIIHTFTREFTEIILNELDTIKDFIDYLKEKEKLILSDKKITLMGGEKELLAYYLTNQRSFKKLEKVDFLLIEEGCWNEFQKKPEYIEKNKQNEISYGWDSIINRAHSCGKGYELIAKELARPNRFERRILAKNFFEAHVLAHNEQKDTFRRMLRKEGTTYCFVFLEDTEPRERRRALLSAVCFIARGIHKKNKKVIGIATEMKIRPTCSYDFCLLEIPKWTKKEQEEMEKLQKETNIFTQNEWKYAHEKEYPLPDKNEA